MSISPVSTPTTPPPQISDIVSGKDGTSTPGSTSNTDSAKTVANELSTTNANGTITVTTTYTDGTTSEVTNPAPNPQPTAKPTVSHNPLADNGSQLATLLQAQEQTSQI